MKKLCAYLMAVLFVSCGFAFGQDLNDGLIAYYPFNGNAHDESGNGLDGTISGATLISDRFEKTNSAFNFDGQNDAIVCPILPDSESISVSFWFKTDKSNTGRQFILFDGDTRGGYDYGIDIVNGSIRLITKDNIEWGISTELIQPSKWHHLVAIHDVSNDVRSIWFDGKLIFTAPLNGGNGNVGNHAELIIGAYGSGAPWDYFFKGGIDEIRLYNRGLSENETRALFNGGPQFQIIEGDFTWQEAKADAEAKGGQLAVLDTQDKIDAANAYLNENSTKSLETFIGLTDEAEEGKWLWLTGAPLTVSNWRDGEPNNIGNEDYVYLKPDDRTWADTKSTTTVNSYLLEILERPPAAPVVELDPFYESNPLEEIVLDATPSEGFPDNFTYQWSFDDFEVPAFLGGAEPTLSLLGTSDQNGTWKVVVSNSVGSTEASFEYRMFEDNDADGISNYREENITLTDPDSADSDSDGLLDPEELYIHETDPNIADVDEDGLNDSEEIDAATDPSVADSDSDGLSDGLEVKTYSSNPNKADTDGDGIADAAEVAAGLDINAAESIAEAVAFLTEELTNRPPDEGL
ncbi:hypothetical protein N8598_03975, partial [Akkermansiaceae bacterium]|nr:hypothetical protein [Akkermansiaceae bacterium]